ncbi:hypothetical protein ACLOJK_010965 [Asimina triloba]
MAASASGKKIKSRMSKNEKEQDCATKFEEFNSERERGKNIHRKGQYTEKDDEFAVPFRGLGLFFDYNSRKRFVALRGKKAMKDALVLKEKSGIRNRDSRSARSRGVRVGARSWIQIPGYFCLPTLDFRSVALL